MNTLTARLVAATTTVAVLSVLLTGLVGIGLYWQGAWRTAATALGRDADLALAVLEQDRASRFGPAVRSAGLERALTRRQISVLTVPLNAAAPQALPVPFTAQDLTALRAGSPVQHLQRTDTGRWVVVGRAGTRTAILLAQPVTVANQQAVSVRPLLLALLVGLLGGVLVAVTLARTLTRPLAATAAAARRITHGEREVHVPVPPVHELADVANALNELAQQLHRTEGRRRQFLQDVSHELRTPLTAVHGYAEGLADGVLTGTEAREAGAVIQRETNRLEHRVRDLLALARAESDELPVQLATTELGPVLQACAAAWQPAVQRAQVQLVMQVSQHPVLVRSDGERLRQIVDALVDNALRVLPAGAPLVLACGSDQHGSWLQVRDGGPGLTDQELARAFERGWLHERYRGHRQVGSGLGLALVHTLATRLGARALAEHAPEGGVAFTVVLPAASPAAHDPHRPRT